jgi:hypothetical protein
MPHLQSQARLHLPIWTLRSEIERCAWQVSWDFM